MSYSIEKTQDEFGNDRWFVANESGNWVGDPHDEQEGAREEMIELNRKLKEKRNV